MLAFNDCNGRKFNPNHIDEKMQAKLTRSASSSRAYMLRRVFSASCDSADSGSAAGGIIGEVRIRQAPLAAAQ